MSDVFAWAVSGEARFLKNLRFMAPFLRIFQRTLFKFGIAELGGGFKYVFIFTSIWGRFPF